MFISSDIFRQKLKECNTVITSLNDNIEELKHRKCQDIFVPSLILFIFFNECFLKKFFYHIRTLSNFHFKTSMLIFRANKNV